MGDNTRIKGPTHFVVDTLTPRTLLNVSQNHSTYTHSRTHASGGASYVTRDVETQTLMYETSTPTPTYETPPLM